MTSVAPMLPSAPCLAFLQLPFCLSSRSLSLSRCLLSCERLSLCFSLLIPLFGKESSITPSLWEAFAIHQAIRHEC